jgi:hypothetical protein
VVRKYKLKKGMSVEVSVYPQAGTVTSSPGARSCEEGKVSKRFLAVAEGLLRRRKRLYRELAK